jgi:CRISPR locus-related DNA-binding protein
VTEEFVITIMRKEIADDIVVTKIADVNDENADVNNENADVKLSSLQAKMIELIKLDGQISQKEIAKRLNVNRTTIYRNIEKLKKQGIIEHFGSDKTGGYRVTGMSV